MCRRGQGSAFFIALNSQQKNPSSPCWTLFSYTPSPFHRQQTEAKILNCVSSTDRRARHSVSGFSSFYPRMGSL